MKRPGTSVLISLLLLILVNMWASQRTWQWDLTADKRYTINDETKAVLQDLESPVDVYVFLQGDHLPAAFKRLQRATRELLNQFEHESKGRIHFEFEDPLKNLKGEERQQRILNLQNRGINPTNVRIKTNAGYMEQEVFPSALLNSGDLQFPVQLLQGQRGQEDINRSIELLEYQLINAITKLQKQEVSTVGFVQGHGELTALETEGLRQALHQNFYRLSEVRLSKDRPISDSIDLLILAKPKEAFSEAEKFALDQFVMKDGQLLLAIDQMKMELDSLKSSWGGENVAVDYQLNLDDLLFQYGLRIKRNLVRDLQSKPIPIVIDANGQTELMPWTFYPVVSGNEQSEIVNNIQPVSFEFASSIDTLNQKTFHHQVLLSSSEHSGLVANPVFVSLEELRTPPSINQFALQHIPMATLTQGQFTSLFQHRGVPVDYTNQIKTESTSSRLALVADGDILKNTVLPNGQVYPLGFDRATGEQFGNQEFLLNLIDYLINPKHPLAARNKDFSIQLLNKTKSETERAKWQRMAFLVPLGLMLILGLSVYGMRKRKYGKS